jgi:hypothetical protein
MFWTNTLVGMFLYCWIYLFISWVVWVAILASKYGSPHVISDEVTRKMVLHFWLKFLWKLSYYLIFVTSYNYAYLWLYDNVPYSHVIIKDADMRCASYYYHAMDDASQGLVTLNWL